MDRLDQRRGFLVSATVHLVLITLLSSSEVLGPTKKAKTEERPGPVVARVQLPPPEVLRQLLPRPPQAPPQAQPKPPPPAVEPPKPDAKDKISIGPPSSERAKVLELRREDDLTKVPKGKPNAVPSAAPTPPPVAMADAAAPREAGSDEPDAPGNRGLRLPPGVGPERGEEGSRARRGAPAPSIASSLRNLERRLQESGPAGIPTGTGQQMGPLFFDPEGADFTVWINHFKNEVYRNWIVPQPALMGFRGHVDIEFTVERNGRLSNLRMLKSSGTPALDRAALNALQGSLLMPLPNDYGPPRASMQVTFFYNEGPRES